MLVGPSTLLNPPNSAASVGSGGCASDGGQKKGKLEEHRDAPVLKLASEGFTRLIIVKNQIRLYCHSWV